VNEAMPDCRNCVFFKLHDTYEYLGYCVNLNEVVVLSGGRRPCPHFREVTLDDLRKVLSSVGFLYCATCGEYIYTLEELEKHLRKHVVTSGFSDDVAGEESPAAD